MSRTSSTGVSNGDLHLFRRAGLTPLRRRDSAPGAAGDEVPFAHRFQDLDVGPAARFGEAAAGLERTSGREIAALEQASQGEAARTIDGIDARDRGDQALRVGMLRLFEQLARRRDLHHPPRIHDADPVGDLRQHAEIVGHVEHRHAEPWREARPAARRSVPGWSRRGRSSARRAPRGRARRRAPWRCRRAAAGRPRADADSAGPIVSGPGRPTRSEKLVHPRRLPGPEIPGGTGSTSTICPPTRMPGLSAVVGFCGTRLDAIAAQPVEPRTPELARGRCPGRGCGLRAMRPLARR